MAASRVRVVGQMENIIRFDGGVLAGEWRIKGETGMLFSDAVGCYEYIVLMLRM